jgi:glycosyltransferase involved in cell wall biosynthesis
MAVAVVIPLYNHEAYIGEAIRSVLSQSRPVDRIVIIDDGSRDRSVEVARGFDDKRITLSTQENAGAHVTLNRAIAEAARDCEFIGILNSDDIYLPGRLEKCVGFLERNPGIDVVASALQLIDQSGAVLDDSNPKARWARTVWGARRDDLCEWLGIANFAKSSSNFVGRRQVFLDHPFRDYRYVHDYFFVVLCALEQRLGIVEEELLLYRTHPSNTIKSDPLEKVTREVLRMNLDLLRELAPRLAESPGMRGRCTAYLRTLMGNHADFRAEVFLHVVAQLIAGVPSEALDGSVGEMTGTKFPELAAPSNRALRKQLAESGQTAAMKNELSRSKWLRLGRKLGLLGDLP